VGLLNGGGNYGVGVRFADGSEEITPVIGAYRFDDFFGKRPGARFRAIVGLLDYEGLPVFGPGINNTIVHELCHSYTNPFVDGFADELEPAGKAIYAHRKARMEQQAYGYWKTMMYESLVRACTVRYVMAHERPEVVQKTIAYQHGRGFTWTGKLAGLLGEYERDRDTYPTLDAFMTKVVEFFESVAEDIEAEDAQEAADAPKVISMNPPNGATDVDPGLSVITVVFDRAMAPGSWSVVGGGPQFPETTGKPSYDVDRRVFSLPVRLKPGWTYRFMLNSQRYTSFRSADGAPIEPLDVTFTTRAE
jgi:hypothetical protein